MLGAKASAPEAPANSSMEALGLAHVCTVACSHARALELVALRLACPCLRHLRPHLFYKKKRNEASLRTSTSGAEILINSYSKLKNRTIRFSKEDKKERKEGENQRR